MELIRFPLAVENPVDETEAPTLAQTTDALLALNII